MTEGEMTAQQLVGRAYVPRRGKRDVLVLTPGFNWQVRAVPPKEGIRVTKKAVRPLIEAAQREARAELSELELRYAWGDR